MKLFGGDKERRLKDKLAEEARRAVGAAAAGVKERWGETGFDAKTDCSLCGHARCTGVEAGGSRHWVMQKCGSGGGVEVIEPRLDREFPVVPRAGMDGCREGWEERAGEINRLASGRGQPFPGLPKWRQEV